jgi:hypothetical protein
MRALARCAVSKRSPPASEATITLAPAPKRRAPRAKPSRFNSAAMGVKQPLLRREVLREGLPEVVKHLKERRADLIAEGFIDDYVALDWLEWRGGGLQVTTVGRNICEQIASRNVVVDDNTG